MFGWLLRYLACLIIIAPISFSAVKQSFAWVDGDVRLLNETLGQCNLRLAGHLLVYSGSGIVDKSASINVRKTTMFGGLISSTYAGGARIFQDSLLSETDVSTSQLEDSCGLQNVRMLQTSFQGTNYASMTEVSLSFRAKLPVGQTAFATAGNITGDGGTYDFVYRISGTTSSAPVLTATVTPFSGSPEISMSSSEAGAIADGGTDAQGSEPTGTAKVVTYTITNSGTDTLNLTNAAPTLSSPSNVGTPVVGNYASTTLAPSGGTTSFTVTYTPAIAGAFSFDLNVISDDPDNNPYTFTVSGIGVDATPPTVTVDIVDASLNDANNSSNVTFEFSETVSGFAAGDLTIVGGTISAFTMVDGDSYTATFTATDNSTTSGSVTVVANSYTDGAANNGAAGNDTVTIDTVNPTVTVDIVDASLNDANNSSNVTFEFSETVSGFTAGDLTIVGGTISAFTMVDGDSYTATFTATDNSTTSGSVTVVANSYTDGAANNGAAGNDTVTIDTENPTVTVDIVDASLNDADNSSNVAFEFSETVSGFTVGDLTIVGGTISAFTMVDGDSYTATFTATDNSTTSGSVTVNAASYTNSSGNSGASGNDTVTIDTENPTCKPSAPYGHAGLIS